MEADVLRDPELLELVLPALRADYRLVEEYQYTPGPRLGCPLMVLAGREDSATTRHGLESWAEQTTAPLQIRYFEGGHFFIRSATAQVVHAVADTVLGWLHG